MRRLLWFSLCFFVAAAAVGSDSVAADTLRTKPKPNLIQRIKSYFDNANKPKEYKRFDISVIGGPYYSTEKSLGAAVVASAFYRRGEIDTLIPPSNMSIFGDLSIIGYVSAGIEGTHILPHDRMRLNYGLTFEYMPTYYWGIGYEAASRASNRTAYTRISYLTNLDFMVRVGRHVYLGPAVDVAFTKALNPDCPDRWEGAYLSDSSNGLGLTLAFDTRDNFTAPTRGVNVKFDQRTFPAWLWNRERFGYVSAKASAYQKVWRGGVIAECLRVRVAYGNVPWCMLSTFGGTRDMRGYYEGQYRDKCAVDFAVELRQHVWRRNGLAVWVGGGSVAPRMSGFTVSSFLPNAGIGYRWEFKKHSNVRVDFGIGKSTNAFLFSINEAF